jgi:hypothetical protein
MKIVGSNPALIRDETFDLPGRQETLRIDWQDQ